MKTANKEKLTWFNVRHEIFFIIEWYLAHSTSILSCFSFSLLQERMEMARMAEEVARQTAEMAIRQMASEGQSIKLSLGSQELLEEPEAE